MRKQIYKPLWYIALIMTAIIIIVPSCASIGTPSGGPRDEDPPRFVSSNPVNGAVDFSGKKAVLTFDELINVKDAFNKVVVSPPGEQTPRVSSLGKRVTVEFRDTLLPNTTYTIDFGNSIVDNNEGNELENFIYTFSTGAELDTLMISGMVLDALDLEPQQGMYVGLHSNLNDTAFTKTRFERIAKTDDYGRFAIGGLAPGLYRVYALVDNDGDLKYSSPEESLAFYETIVSPASERITVSDTIFNLKTGVVDSVVSRERTRFLPNNILMRSYNSGYKQQYITTYERPDSARLHFVFNAATDSAPRFTVLDSQNRVLAADNEGFLRETSFTNDTITLWLRNKNVIDADTLRVAVNYYRADSLYNPIAVSDTLRMLKPIVKPLKADKKDKKKQPSDSIVPQEPTVSFKTLTTKLEKTDVVTIESAQPLEYFDTLALRLEIKEDTVWKELPRPGLLADSLHLRRFKVYHDWDFDSEYRLTIDSLAGRSIYGLKTAPLQQTFKIRPENEYSTIKLNIHDIPDSVPAFVELLEGSGNVRNTLTVSQGSVTFPFLLAGKYYARIIIDRNGNGQFDPGNFELSIQPDISYYYPEAIELKQNWDQEKDWHVFATPVDMMKPKEIRRAKINKKN